MNNLISIIRLFALSFILLSLSNCGSNTQANKRVEFDKKAPFVISEIYAQDWVAGVQGGGSGTNLHITFDRMQEGLVIESIYFRKKKETPKQSGKAMSYTCYFKEDLIRDLIMDGDPVKEAQNTPPVPFPFDLKNNEAVVNYLVHGKEGFFKIIGIVQKPMIAYPATNPKGID
jgi:hypothetical protein